MGRNKLLVSHCLFLLGNIPYIRFSTTQSASYVLIFLCVIYYKHLYVCCFLLLIWSFCLDSVCFDNLHTIELNLFTSIIFCLFRKSQLCVQFSLVLQARQFLWHSNLNMYVICVQFAMTVTIERFFLSKNQFGALKSSLLESFWIASY